MPVRKFDSQQERVETGPIQFGDDWPGVFIRGDHALHYSMLLENLLNGKIPQEDFISLMVLHGLKEDLASCDVRILGEENVSTEKGRKA